VNTEKQVISSSQQRGYQIQSRHILLISPCSIQTATVQIALSLDNRNKLCVGESLGNRNKCSDGANLAIRTSMQEPESGRHSVPFWSACRTSKIESKSETDEKRRYSLFAQLGAFLGNCALPSTKREGSTGYGGCARICGRGRRRTALDGSLTHRSYQIHANMPFNWSVAAFPPCLNIAS